MRPVALFALAGLLPSFVGCGSDSTADRFDNALEDNAVTIGSFDFPESELLAEIYGQALEAGGFEVRLVAGLGPREFVQPALAGGLVEFVPEYSGSALEFLSLGESSPTADPKATRAALDRVLDDSRIVALAPAPAQDANAVVVPAEVADRYDLHDISDLVGVAPRLTFGGPPECPRRPFCLEGLERVYGLEFDTFLPLDAGGPLTRQALAGGHVDVALSFTTHPSIATDDLVVLADDRKLQPAENVTPLIRTEVVERGGESFVRLVDAVSRRLTTDDLRAMNAQVARGESPAAVATGWLGIQGHQ